MLEIMLSSLECIKSRILELILVYYDIYDVFQI